MQTLSPVTWPSSLCAKLEKTALEVAEVFAGSPADRLGIQPGWEILHLNAAAPDLDQISMARRGKISDLHLRDPASGQILAVGPGPFPLGMIVVPKANDGLKDLIRSRKRPVVQLHQMWNLGHWKDFAALTEPIESALLPLGTALLGRLAGAEKRKAGILAAKDYEMMQLLALAWLANGRSDDSMALLDRAEQARIALGHDRQPTSYWALGLFLRALAAFAKGHAARAMQLAEAGAQDYGAESPGLLRLYGELSGRGPLESVSPLLNRPFVIDYSLQQTDVFGVWPSPGTPVTLSRSLGAMTAGQILLVYALGEYRTNGPMQDELASLIALYAHDPRRIAGVHLISERTNPDSTWKDRNEIEGVARQRGVPLVVLSDRESRVAGALALQASPSLYVLDAAGTVRATEPLVEERGYWLALARMAANPPAAA